MTLLLGVTGSISAYKAADLISRMRKQGVTCHVMMTKNAAEFVSPLTFECLSGNPVTVSMFGTGLGWQVQHITLAKKADVFAIIPATGNIIGKLANGIADDMITSTALACTAPIMVAPAMNVDMYSSASVQANLKTLKERGFIIVEPATGRLACGDVGKGKLADVEYLEQAILHEMYRQGEFGTLLEGRKVLVTAGRTVEALDPVRYLTNYSSGKMGYAFAEAAAKMGAEVTLVSGPSILPNPYGVNVVGVTSSASMEKACLEHAGSDIVVMAAAPADFVPVECRENKIKKEAFADSKDGVVSFDFKLNRDIISKLTENKKESQVVVAFAAETENIVDNAQKKLAAKRADYIVANDITEEGAGFGSDTNIATLISKKGDVHELPKMTKIAMAEEVLKIISGKN